MESGANRPGRWAMILAGGEGIRLRPLTRRITGDDRPKQFCPIVDGETMLDRTRTRVARIVRPERTCLVLTRAHERFYGPLLAKWPLGPLVVQPCGRGTAPAVLYGLLRVAEGGLPDPVALFPSDHYVSDDARFMDHVEAAFAAVEAQPDLVILLGIEADGPEVQYGWIEAGEPLPGPTAYPVYRVRRFWEKPPLAIAETLFERGCLWNSFVLVARVRTLCVLIRAASPVLHAAFMTAWHRRSTIGERRAMRSLYAELPSTSFSADVLGMQADKLAVLPVRGVTWSDWGAPARVLGTLTRLGIRPAWAAPAATAVLASAGSGR
ncbi:MAG TPA: sugar phosphate nucleotidyltransferase [Methylomirabilota bacterium]|nr:sugar phosphate nucleotidyltransferase [Methylomirabilota bacterium]